MLGGNILQFSVNLGLCVVCCCHAFNRAIVDLQLGDLLFGAATGLPRFSRVVKVATNAVPNLAEARPDIGGGEEESIAEDADVDSIYEWELDFCSRPILDSRGKKLWELVVCDSRRQLQFTRFFPNNVINSVTLRDALLYIMDTLQVPKPEKIRFFR